MPLFKSHEQQQIEEFTVYDAYELYGLAVVGSPSARTIQLIGYVANQQKQAAEQIGDIEAAKLYGQAVGVIGVRHHWTQGLEQGDVEAGFKQMSPLEADFVNEAMNRLSANTLNHPDQRYDHFA